MATQRDPFGARKALAGAQGVMYFDLQALSQRGATPLERLPVTVRVLLENALRFCGVAGAGGASLVSEDDVVALARWTPNSRADGELAFMPARVLLQDFTGVPCVVDLASMRQAMRDLGGDPRRINPLVPADLVIDHSVQVDLFGTMMAFAGNVEREYERNSERYALLRWAQQAFENFRVVPPGTGIVHQVNLEYLAKVVQTRPDEDGALVAFPDTLVGTDSHTTMINGLGVLGWGVGGIEAEAVLLGQPLYLLTPVVVGMRLTGQMREGTTATDLVLTVTQMLRQHGVVNKFVEFSGPGLSSLSLPDRATISNMSPEFGATATLFPVDDVTLGYLRLTGREEDLISLVERYTKEQGIFRTDATPDPDFDEKLELDLATIEPSLAGPRRPEDRVALGLMPHEFQEAFRDRLRPPSEPGNAQARMLNEGPAAVATLPPRTAMVEIDGEEAPMTDGSVVIAAITSCTNTSNPSVMIGAGLLAKHAVERGLTVRPYVKTSMAPGSRVVTDYLNSAGLMPFLEALHFHIVGYGCTTCLAEGTPVLLANGTARRIEQMPSAGGAALFGPTADGKLSVATQTEAMNQGLRDCISLTLQDGRTLVCTPDHEILCADGRWVRADQLVLGRDRVVVGLEAPVDEPGEDETGCILQAGEMTFTLDTPQERHRTLAFARLVGHLLSDGSISVHGQGRMNVGQAVDREVVLNDVELITGKRPAATQYDDRKWAIVLPMELTKAITALPGVRVGRRIDQAPTLPAFVLDERCPVAIVREFLGGLFGADGHAPILHRLSDQEGNAILEPPAFSQSAKPEHVGQLKRVIGDLTLLLARCGVTTNGAKVYEYPTRHTASSYPAAQDGIPRIEVRLEIGDGLSFVERVGFRYCVDKQLRASAAAVYWRTINTIDQQRLWMSARREELHQTQPAMSFSQARRVAATRLMERETAVFPHSSLLEGHDRFTRLPQATMRKFQPLHRDSCDFPSPAEMFSQIGVRDWFAPLLSREETDSARRCCVEKDALELPTLSLQVIDRRPAGERAVFDLSVNDVHAFVAGTVAVHNCIGNSGPLPQPVSDAIRNDDLVVAAVLSGNRNFEARIHGEVRANYLASPPLVVAFALAGTIDVDLTTQPLGHDPNGEPVYLRDIWPSQEEIDATMRQAVSADAFRAEYSHVFDGDDRWRALPVPAGELFVWDEDSTYVRNPPFFDGLAQEPAPVQDITGARALVVLGDSVTTDHISPAGSIRPDSPAGRYLIEHGVQPRDFNSYGARRGNHEVMMRGTFGNIRLKNALANGKEGFWTRHLPDGDEMTIYDAAMRYIGEGTPLVVLAGKDYGMGSSRDWAAKGTLLLGVHAVLAETFERIHRSNLVGMGVLPLQYRPGENRQSLGLDGTETFTITGIASDLTPHKEVQVQATRADGTMVTFNAIARLDSAIDIEYYRHGGILPYVLRRLAR
jgi:aconitase A